MVVKRYLEPEVEPHFHPDSYGYRPGKSALEAVGQARQRCWRYDWVLDLDIQGFFDNIDHELMLRAVLCVLSLPTCGRPKPKKPRWLAASSGGPLQSIPIGLKDTIATGSIRTTVGSKVLTDDIPSEDAYVVRLCQAAGAIILAKENLEEFAAGATSKNPHYGAVHNPWVLEHIPGGSSGWGGANVAACVTFASLGTDLGGSVRLPAVFCGVVGLNQTFGRVSQRGILVTSFNSDHIGPLTRSVRDSALMLQVIAGYDSLDPSTGPVPVPDYTAALGQELRGLRMGIPTNYYFDLLDHGVEAAVR